MTGQQLKNSILQMAVQGKLVPQDSNDEPASVLIERIRKEKEQLIKAGKIKKEKNPSYIFRGADNLPYEKVGKNEPVCIADEVPFEIPESWEWVRLKNITVKEIKRGKSPKYADSSNVYVFAQKCNVKLGGIDISLAKCLDVKAFEKYPIDEYMVNEDIIINSTGNGTLGRIGMFHDSDRINDFTIFPDSHITIIRACKYLIKNYLFHTLKYYQPYLEKLGEGSTNQTELRPSTVAELFIPIPPMGEQKRIIEKLLEVIPMVNAYGDKEKELQVYNSDFPTQLKKSILQEAVQGKLVTQDPSDEPASVLLERIRAEKERLIQEGKIKRDKHESIIYRRDNSHYEKLDGIERCIDDEIPFEIPNSWAWRRLGSIATVQSSKRVFEKDYVAEGIPFFRSKEIGDLYRGEEIHLQLFITKEHYDRLKREYGVPKPGDILITSVGTIGNSWICDGREFYYKDGNITQICANPYLSSQYIQLFINSPLFIEQAQSTVSGTAYNALTIIKLKNMLIPVPPLSEQHRIVEQQKKLFDKIMLI